jgi:hypothetical protein
MGIQIGVDNMHLVCVLSHLPYMHRCLMKSINFASFKVLNSLPTMSCGIIVFQMNFILDNIRSERKWANHLNVELDVSGGSMRFLHLKS